jgi:hypothetical protein
MISQGIDVNALMDWLMKLLAGGVTAGVILTLIVIGLLAYIGVTVVRKLVVQFLLFFVTWVPSVIIAFSVDFSQLSIQPVIPLKGLALILYPYTLDVLYGNFYDTALGTVCFILIFISYIAFLQWSIHFANIYHYNKLYIPLIAYIVLLALGLGMLNTHAVLFNYYINYMITIGVHPSLPILLFITLLALIILLIYGPRLISRKV